MALTNCPECNREISDKAGACPNCGHPLEKIISDIPVDTFPHSNAKSCPSCKSENTQSIRMMCLSGTTSNSLTGFGVSSDLDIGAGRINSNSRTVLAAKFMPGENPQNQQIRSGCFCTFLGTAILIFVYAAIKKFGISWSSDNLLKIFVVLGSILLFLGILILSKIIKMTTKAQVDEWEAKTKLCNEGWICHQCGNTWFP